MKKPLTDNEKRQLRHLLNRADLPPDVLDTVLRCVAPKRGGRRKKVADTYLLPGLELFVRIAQRDLHLTRDEAIEAVAKAFRPVSSGASNLKAKLLKGRFHKRPIETLVLSGVDPMRYRIPEG